jgi:hypothetical protein
MRWTLGIRADQVASWRVGRLPATVARSHTRTPTEDQERPETLRLRAF